MDTEQIVKQAQGTLEVVMLEELFNEECKCEAVMHSMGPCAIHPVAKFSWCGRDKWFLECSVAINYNQGLMEIGSRCPGCGRYSADCWKIIPI